MDDALGSETAEYLAGDVGDAHVIPSSCKSTIDGHTYRNVGNKVSEEYSGQEWKLLHRFQYRKTMTLSRGALSGNGSIIVEPHLLIQRVGLVIGLS